MIPIQILALPERKEKALKNKEIQTLDDLLMYLPRRYDDLRQWIKSWMGSLRRCLG